MGIIKRMKKYSGLYFLRKGIHLFFKNIIVYPIWKLLKGFWWLTQKFSQGLWWLTQKFFKHIIIYPIWNLLKGLWWLNKKVCTSIKKWYIFIKGNSTAKFILVNIGWFILFVLSRTLAVYIAGLLSNIGINYVAKGVSTAMPLLSLLISITWNFWYIIKRFLNDKKGSK